MRARNSSPTEERAQSLRLVAPCGTYDANLWRTTRESPGDRRAAMSAAPGRA